MIIHCKMCQEATEHNNIGIQRPMWKCISCGEYNELRFEGLLQDMEHAHEYLLDKITGACGLYVYEGMSQWSIENLWGVCRGFLRDKRINRL